jgi:hypothetical protein
MARPVDPDAQYRIKLHVTSGYTYASTQPPSIDPETGKKKYRHIHWGTVVPAGRQNEKLKFIPGSTFYLASPEERNRLIFPEDWDMSEVEKLTGVRKTERAAYTDDCESRLYGDIWLLEQVAIKTGIRQDLEVVFNENCEFVDDILTLAMYFYLTEFNYSRVARWQRTVRTPSSRELTPTAIIQLTQCITRQHRMDLLRRRAAKLAKSKLCAVDSKSRSVYGNNLVDTCWGRNMEDLPLEQTTEVIVYTLSSHIPAYYSTFPGNMPDSQSIEVILADLERAGFKDLVLITDRGYDSLCNLEKYMLRGQSMVMGTTTDQRDIVKVIQEFGEFDAVPEGMVIDSSSGIYHKQYDIDYEVESTGESVKASNRLKLNLYFDPTHRARELLELDIALLFQRDALLELLENGEILDEDATIKRDYYYYNIVYDPATRVIESFEVNEKKVAKKRKLSGFFAIMTHGMDSGAMETFSTYCLRDEQEKYFQEMKDRVQSDWQRNWSKDGKTGWLFIQFVSLIISSYMRYIWKTTKLCDLFSSPLDILDEMRPILIIEHPNRAKVITPFVEEQVEICEAFGIQIPEGCSTVSRQKPNRKR